MSVDLSGYPAAPFLMISKTLDLICDNGLFQCQNWRDHLPFCKEELSYKVGPMTDVLTPMMTFQEFLDGRNSTLSLVKEFLFDTPSTALADLTTPTAVMVLVVLILLLKIIKSILLPFFSSIGRRAGRMTHGPQWEAQNETRIVKFGEYVFRLLFHFSISVFGVYYFWDKPWWTNTKHLWLEFPFHPVEPGMTWYYLVQSAYNLEAFLFLLVLSIQISFHHPSKCFPIQVSWSKTVRGDFREMLIHHVVTNLLIVGSSYCRLTRIGSMVFLVHDLTDVPVDLSKLANFVKWKRTTAVCFATMVITWAYFRLGVLPFIIYRSVLTESSMILDSGFIDPTYYLAYRYFFYYLMGQIIMLHVAWFLMFLRMGYLLVFRGEAHDLSEHKKGEEQLTGDNSLEAQSNGHVTTTATNGKKQH